MADKGEPRGKERRASARVPVDIWVEENGPGGRVFRRTANLSRGGMRLEHAVPLPAGMTLRLRFTLPGDTLPVEVAAAIVGSASEDAFDLGLRFVDLSPEALARIDAFLTRSLARPLAPATSPRTPAPTRRRVGG